MLMHVEIDHGLGTAGKVEYDMTVPDEDRELAHQRVGDALREYREKQRKPGEVESNVIGIECNESGLVLVVTSQYSDPTVMLQVAEIVQRAVRRPETVDTSPPDIPIRKGWFQIPRARYPYR